MGVNSIDKIKLEVSIENHLELPVIKINGKEINNLVSVQYTWITNDDELRPGNIRIEYYDNDELKVIDEVTKIIGIKNI